MTSRRWAASLAAAAVCLSIGPGPAGARETGAPGVARFRIETRAFFHPIPKELQSIDCWVPAPFASEVQRIEQLVIQGPYIMQTTELPDHRTTTGYMQSGPRGGVPMQVKMGFYVERTEDRHQGLGSSPVAKAGPGRSAEGEQLVDERWLKPDPTGLADKDLKTRAAKIVSKAKTPVAKARAVYDYVIDNIGVIDRVRELQGSGRGDLSVTLKAMKGDSVDLAALFVALCRAAGVPARTVTGWKFPSSVKRGSMEVYHGWAEFHLAGAGWIPVDPADGKRNPARRDYYFGSVDERRVALSVGREVKLTPPQTGPALNYFVRAYWEGDGQPMPEPPLEVEFEEVDEIPKSEIQLTEPPGSTPSGPRSDF